MISQSELKQLLSSKFDFEEWKPLLGDMFNQKIDYLTKEIQIDASLVKNGGQIGSIRLDDGRSLGLFKFEVADNIIIARNRKGLREIAAKYVDQDIIHGALVFYYSKQQPDYRLTFVSKQTVINSNGELEKKETAPKRYTFLLGENEPCTTAASRLHELIAKSSVYLADVTDAFSVERLNKEFFKAYKEQYQKFLKYLNADTKANRDYVKKLLGRLVFLHFLQKKGWMGVPLSNPKWEGGDKAYLLHLVERNKGNNRFLTEVLKHLFFKTLNDPRTDDKADPLLGDNIKIPYLNGGLFDKDDLDKQNIDFPYTYFKELMEFFAWYNFTIDENDPDDSEIGIDPEMLGHIFENLLEDNKDKGAFYTPKEIVQYMSRESVSQYLKTGTPDTLHAAIDTLVKQKQVEPLLQIRENARLVNRALETVKVCDPAIGSGAFPMGVLNVLFDCRHLLYGFIGENKPFSYADIKKQIIQNNIYGVDIEQGAVDIARLRFWLALVVDENEPQPLPNLDYKIMCGDSLLHRFALDAPFQDVLKDYNRENNTNYTLDDYRRWVYDYTNISDHTQKDDFRNRIEEIKHAFKTELSKKEKTKIAKVRGAIANLQMADLFGSNPKDKEKELKKLQKQLKTLEQQRDEIISNKIYEHAFEWRFEFPALLDNDGNFTGFDIVIANPPYIDSETMTKVMPQLRELYAQKYTCTKGNWDMFVAFVESGLGLLNSNGIYSFIIPNKLIAAKYAETLRDKIANHSIIEIRDYGNISVFTNAAVYPATIVGCLGLITSKKDITFSVMKTLLESDISNTIGNREFSSVRYWDTCFTPSEVFKLFSKINNHNPLKEVSSISVLGAATVSEAYLIKNVLLDGKEINAEFKVVNTGTIDRYTNLWGVSPMQYIKDKYIYPVVYESDLANISRKRLSQAKSDKIIVAGMSKMIEAVYDEGSTIAGKSTSIILGNTNELKYLLAIINSKLATFFVHTAYNSLKMAGGFINIGVREIENIPIPKKPTNYQLIVKLVDTIHVKKKSNPQADTSSEEQQIDHLVYHLYGLSYDEVLIIDPSTPITKDDYEAII